MSRSTLDLSFSQEVWLENQFKCGLTPKWDPGSGLIILWCVCVAFSLSHSSASLTKLQTTSGKKPRGAFQKLHSAAALFGSKRPLWITHAYFHLYLIINHMIFWILKFMLMSPLRSEIRSTGAELLLIIIMTAQHLRMELFLVQVLNSRNLSHRQLYLSLNCDSPGHTVNRCSCCLAAKTTMNNSRCFGRLNTSTMQGWSNRVDSLQHFNSDSSQPTKSVILSWACQGSKVE